MGVGTINMLKKKAYDLIYVHKKSQYIHTVKFLKMVFPSFLTKTKLS